MNLPSLLVLFVGGWGVAPNTQNNLFYSNKFSFLDEYISAYPSLTIASSESSLIKRYKKLGGGTPEEKGLLSLLSEHQIRLIAIAGAERYGLLTRTLTNDPGLIDEGNAHYCSVPPVTTLSERPEASLPQMAKVIDQQMKYTRDAVVFAAIESVSIACRYHSADLVHESIIATDKYLKKVIQEALIAGMRVLLIGDSSGAEVFGDQQEGTETLLPVVYIAKDQEGLRASHEDYASESVFPLKPSGTIDDIAPTILSLMHIPKPEYMGGKNLFAESLT